MQSEQNATRKSVALKICENRARRALRRQGRIMLKSHVRDPSTVDYGQGMVINLAANVVEVGELCSPQALTIGNSNSGSAHEQAKSEELCGIVAGMRALVGGVAMQRLCRGGEGERRADDEVL